MPRLQHNSPLPQRLWPQDLTEVTGDFDRRLRSGDLESYRPTPLGFPEIDASLGGGLLSENIALVGGMQNVGKTILVTQAARHAAATGDVLPIVVCYEHSPLELLHRLLCMESVAPDGPRPDGVTREAIQSAVLAYYDAHPDPRERERLNLQWILERVPGADRAWERMAPYLHRLWLVQGDGMDTMVETLGEYVKAAIYLVTRTGYQSTSHTAAGELPPPVRATARHVPLTVVPKLASPASSGVRTNAPPASLIRLKNIR